MAVEEPEHSILRPNMLALNGDLTSSTLATLSAAHSIITGSNWFNSMFHACNLEGTTFQISEFDGALFENCSLRGVEIRNCDIDGLIINGIRVGQLLKLLMVEEVASDGNE